MNFKEKLKISELEAIKFLEEKGYDIGVTTDLQRTEEWFQQRKGKFTGSGIKNLMKTSRATARQEWGRAEKTIDFGASALKYIFEKAMEIKRNKVIHLSSSAAMRYGTENEDIALKIFLSKHSNLVHKEVGFLEFLPGIAGASPDGQIVDKITGDVYAYENKCAVAWGTFYDRISDVDEKHIDFWQLQAEMLSLKTEKCIYTVAEPSENIFEPNITDVFDTVVEASKTHQKAMIDRCRIGHSAIQYFLKGENIDVALEYAISEYKLK